MIKTQDYKVNKYDGLDGLTYQAWNEDVGGKPVTRAKASSKGIELFPPILETRKDLELFAMFIDKVWRIHLTLVPKLSTTLSEQ